MSLTELVAIIVACISAIGSIGAVVLTLKKTSSDLDEKNLQSYETRVQLLESEKEDTKKRLLICEGLHRENLAEKGKMQGVIETMERTLENRDPRLQEVLTGILLFMEKIEVHIKSSSTPVK